MRKTVLFPVLNAISAIVLLSASAGPIQYTFSLTPGAQITSAIADPAGDVYFAGSTSVAIPTTPGTFRRTFAACAPIAGSVHVIGRSGCSWAFVGKLSPTGTPLWLTYLPEPNGNSSIAQISIDGGGNVYVAGTFATVNNLPSAFPVTAGGFETTAPGSSGTFIAKLNPSGSGLDYATYFNNIASVGALYPDTQGNLYLGMRTEGLVDLPLVNPLPGMAPSIESGYLAKLNATGSGLLMASWVNGPGARSGIDALTMDAAGDLYVVGGCSYATAVVNPCIPTTPGAYQSSMKGQTAIYVMKLRADDTLQFATLLAGSGTQGATGIAVDAAGNLELAGGLNGNQNEPLDFPVTQDAIQATAVKRNRGTATSGFLAKLDASGSSLLYSTYFGGSSYDSITGFALDSQGNRLFSGYSYSPDLPVSLNGWQVCHPAPNFTAANGPEADFIGKLSADGRTLQYGSFVGPGALGAAGSTLRLVGSDLTGDLFLLGTQSGFPVLIRYRMTAQPKGSAVCVVSDTHGYESALSPMGIVRLRGNDISGGRSSSPKLTTSRMLPVSYNGLQVFIGDSVAPLLKISPNEITVVVPAATPVGVSSAVRVLQYGVVTAELDSTAQFSEPGIITVDNSGLGSATALNQDGSVNSHANPAEPGSVVTFFLTGLGISDPQTQAGSIVKTSGSLIATVQAELYIKPAEVLYAGPAPGLLAGVFQMNIRVPVTGIQDWVQLQVGVSGQGGQSQVANAGVGIYVSCPAGSTCVTWPTGSSSEIFRKRPPALGVREPQ